MLDLDLREFSALVEGITSSPPKKLVSISFEPVDYSRVLENYQHARVIGEFDKEVSVYNDLFHYDGHGVIVYIKEHVDLELVTKDPYTHGKKYHLTNCSTVQIEKKQNRFGRFVALQYTNELMPISDSKGKQAEAMLCVCKSCMRELKFRPYLLAKGESEKERICREFDLVEFLKKRDCYFPDEYLPIRLAEYSSFSYAGNWREMSISYRASQQYCCEQCRVSLVTRKTLLHTHHIDGVKSNNSVRNLMALCKECHSKQPNHGNIKLSEEELSDLKELRCAST
ncbi:HNH endonuclease signature motif containing protein [Vibrio sp. 10N.222.49.A3]|uniref:HNH endonuclease n=1 Tax=unclassified Vibrio TaxID=2614977 RepID=UPI000068B014|nr:MULTISPECIES: HNH endonuclease signature motif containing protein [Vibrio]EAQ53527.1 hypothetical protein MED222_15374 [Vibrio sp. MED222]OEF62610.1 hypothetical protein A152_06825 [Vibrio tasmaniensis 1F-187]